MELNFRIIGQCDLEDVLALLERSYVVRETITARFNQGGTLFDYHSERAKKSLPHNVSIGAYDRNSGSLVGMRLGILGLGKYDNTKFERIYSQNDPFVVRQIKDIFRSLYEGQMQETLDAKNYIKYSLLCVDDEYLNQGIGSELVRRSHMLAIKKGCKNAFTSISSHYALLLAQKFGYRVVKSIAYTDYVDPFTGEKILEDISPPHLSLSLVVKNFEELPGRNWIGSIECEMWTTN